MSLLEVARIIRPHGLRGEVVVDLVTNRFERLADGAVLFDTNDDVASVDSSHHLVVESSRPHQGRFLVRFAGVVDHAAAEALRGTTLFASPVRDDESLFVHELVGKRVVDVDGKTYGVVTSVEANPASDLLVVDDRYYVPARFVVSNGDEIVVDTPEGLFS